MSRKREQKKRQNGNELIKTMVATGVAGVIIIILMAVIMFGILDPEDKNATNSNESAQTIDKSTDDTIITFKKEMVKITGVILDINYSDKDVIVSNVEVEEDINIKLDNAEILDEYGKPMIIQELQIGDIIYSKYDKNNGVPEIFRLSSEAWEYTTKELMVNKEEKMVYRGTEGYYYTDQLIVIDHGGSFSMDTLTEVDKVTIKGYKDRLCSIEIIDGHGYIELINYSFFVDAVISVDRDQTFIIKENMEPILVSEGSHKVVLEKEGYEDYIEEVVVLPNTTATVDLDEFQIKKGQVEFKIDRKNVLMYLNDILIEDIVEPVLLDYGEYKLSIVDNGKVIYEEQLIVDKLYMLYNITVAEPELEPDRQVHINSGTIGAQVFVNNKFVGYTPISIKLEPGDHSVLLTKEGYKNATYNINIADSSSDLNFTFPAMTPLGSETEEEPKEPSNNYPDNSNGNNSSNGNSNNSGNDNSNSNNSDNSLETPISDVYNN
ncbi:PEGA domain-containing protein [Vallitalea okinawensis]|uniref:PEGA domain-containing protein n=1 Tax=Vallitalea okinawensis TaxID=2078660 RepID=UPI000CFB4B89|nr:PEGA domain-containing protein [Vallitalea okinawensis]